MNNSNLEFLEYLNSGATNNFSQIIEETEGKSHLEQLDDTTDSELANKFTLSESKGEPHLKPIEKTAPGLLRPSKKISKLIRRDFIQRDNAEKLEPFFTKWKVLRKCDKALKTQVKLWFSSFNVRLNKTYLYREFFGAARVHFRLAVRDDGKIDFKKLQEGDWRKLFVNLTSFLMEEARKCEEMIKQGRKSQVYPVWIEDINKFKIENFSADQQESDLPRAIVKPMHSFS